MIASLWESLVSTMRSAGWVLDQSEADSLADHHYTIKLPAVTRDSSASTTGRARVIRSVRVRLQFRDRKDAYLGKAIAEEIEKVVVALRGTPFLFESADNEERTGGTIAEVVFSARDSMN